MFDEAASALLCDKVTLAILLTVPLLSERHLAVAVPSLTVWKGVMLFGLSKLELLYSF